MHLSIIIVALGLAVLVRLCWLPSNGVWADRWHQALGTFLFPPLLFGVTSVAVLCMGHHGTMLGLTVGWIGCLIALGFLGYAGVIAGFLVWQGWRSLQQMQTYPPVAIAGTVSRVLDTSALFAAQIGIWQPEVVVSQGLLQTLTPDQLEAVLSHEQAHFYYRDNFWFLGLGWVCRLTHWLPNTEALWQELLLLRELRADRWAAQQVDALVLAESLLQVVQSPLDGHCFASPLNEPLAFYAAFGNAAKPSRLAERIESLISQPQFIDDVSNQKRWRLWVWLPLTLLPLLTVPLHM